MWKIFFEKFNWLKSYLALIFEFPAILLLFLVHFKMLYLLKQLSFSKTIFTFVSITTRPFKIIYLFCHSLKFIFCCQSCDVIFPPINVKIEKQKTQDFLEYKVLPSCKVWAQTNEKCKSSFYLVIFCVLYAHRANYQLVNKLSRISPHNVLLCWLIQSIIY